jgi:hypothetical protein
MQIHLFINIPLSHHASGSKTTTRKGMHERPVTDTFMAVRAVIAKGHQRKRG